MKWLSLVLMLMLLPLPKAAADRESPGALIERGSWKQARALLEPRVKANPRDAEALALLSSVREAFGDARAGFDLAEQAVALDPKNAAFHERLAEECGTLAENAGPLHQFGLARRFKKEAETAIALDPGQTDAREALMMFYLKAPGIIGGDRKKAHDMADQILQIKPLEGNLAHARLALEEKDTTAACGFYQKAIEADSKDVRPHLALASLYTLPSRRQWDLAEREALLAQRLDPHRAAAYGILAQLYAHLERWAELDTLLQQAETEAPDNLNPCYQAGRVLLLDGRQLERAEGYFRKYLAREPEGEAPALAAAHWRLGQVLEKQGHRPEAVAELETALRLKPDLDGAKKDLKRLRS